MGIKNNSFFRGLFYLYKRNLLGSRKGFGFLAKDVIITPPFHFDGKKNIYIGEKTGISPYCYLSTPKAKITIKGNCSIAEHLTIHTGNHARIIGKFITDINDKNKPEGYDRDVIIEKDVWIGANVTILAGVTVGRGATIAAGAVVNRDAPPYSVVGGVPAKVIKFNWTIDQIIEHEEKLYPEEERMSREELKNIFGTNGI